MKPLIRLVILFTATILTASAQISTAQTHSSSPSDLRVKVILDQLGIKYKIDARGDFKIGMRMKDGRTQVAWIGSQTANMGNMEIREILSTAYKSNEPLPAEVANRLLIDNTHKKIGAWETLSKDNAYMVVYCSQIPADIDAQTLEAVLRGTLKSADDMEKELTGKDAF